MRKILYTLLTALILLVPSIAGAQGVIRHTYSVDGYQYVGTERTLVKAGSSDKHPFLAKLEYVVFPDDNSTAYILEIDYEEERNFNFPKEVQLRATTNDGKSHTFKQYAGTSSDKHQFTAADGKTKVYWNVGKYMLEKKDIDILCSGIKYLEVTYSWAPDGFYRYTYDKDEFSTAMKSLTSVIDEYKDRTVEMVDIADYVDNLGSTTVVTVPVEVGGGPVDFRMQMTYLYYKSTNTEDYDLTMAISGEKEYSVPYESELEFTFEDGTAFNLKQEREGENIVFLFPSIEQAKKLAYDKLKSIKIPLEDGSVLQQWDDNAFGEAVRVLYNTLQAVSVL